jgi:hypothetical protein
MTATTSSISARRMSSCAWRRTVSSFGCWSAGRSGQERSDHWSQSSSFVVPSSAVIREDGDVPSRCSSAATTNPREASSPQKAEYISREQPTPCEKITSGHFSPAAGVRSGAFFEAGNVVPEIAAAASGSGGSQRGVGMDVS